MKRVAIISSCSLPIPATKGGAVETLVENIVKENERNRKINLSIISVYDKEADIESNKYVYSNFIYFKKNSIIKQSDLLITQMLKIIKKDKSISSRNYIWKLITLKKLVRHLIKNDYDYLVIENTIYLFNIFKNNKLRKKYKGKYFFHVHNDIVKVGDKKSVLECKKFIGISQYIKKNIVHVLGNEIKPKVDVLYNGIDTSLFSRNLLEEERKNLLNKLEIEKNKKIILFAGRITPEKGVKELLQALEKIKREDIVLLIVGSSYFGNNTFSKFENEIMTLIDNMKEKVVFTGYVKNEVIWKYYQLATMAVLPSMWDEPLGLTMIEAKCSGIPIITTKSGGIPETIKNGQGILLERDENIVDNIKVAIENVLDNLEVWERTTKLSREEALKQNSLDNYYKNFIDIIMN